MYVSIVQGSSARAYSDCSSIYEEQDDDDDDWGNDTARACMGWEDDMIKNGGLFCFDLLVLDTELVIGPNASAFIRCRYD